MFMIARACGMRRTDPPGQVGTGEKPPGFFSHALTARQDHVRSNITLGTKALASYGYSDLTGLLRREEEGPEERPPENRTPGLPQTPDPSPGRA
eukprot:superscaffoldBa00002624_g14828